MQNEIHIDVNQIPEFQRIALAKTVLALTEQAFSMPGAEECYQAWLKEYRAKQKKKAEQEGFTDETGRIGI